MNTYALSTLGTSTSVLTLTSLIDPNENQEILKSILENLDNGYINWIVDLQYMNFLNSTGLNFLISLLTRARTKGGEVVLTGVSERIQQVFVLTRLQNMFQMLESQDAAVDVIENSKNISEN